jgi:hypothetical protein
MKTARIWGNFNYYKISVTLLPQILSETFHILTRIKQDFVINKHMSSCKLPVIIIGI